MNLDQRELARIVETCSPKGCREKEMDSKYSSRIEAEVSELVRRGRLAFIVCPAKTILVQVDTRAALTVATMLSLVRVSGTGAENSMINSRLVLVRG